VANATCCGSGTATERNHVSLPQRSPAPALHRPMAPGQRAMAPGQRAIAPGQRPYVRPAVPGGSVAARPFPAGARPQPGVGPTGLRPMTARPAPAQPALRPVQERPAPRAGVAFLTVAEVAAIMRVSKMTVYRLVHGGELAAVRVGRSFRVPERAVRDYLADARTDGS
jgi:excisionase family DNA binding protein